MNAWTKTCNVALPSTTMPFSRCRLPVPLRRTRDLVASVSNRRVAVALAAAAVVAGACTSSSLNSTNPTAPKCQVTTSTPGAIGANGGTTVVAITAQPECAWTVAVQTNWIAEVQPTSGQGPGEVAVRVNANTQPSTRQGSVQINGVSIPISQTAAACVFTVNPGALTMTAAGGNTTVDVSAMTGCTWTASADSTWLRIASGANGNGNGAVTLAVTANTGAARSATATIAGQPVTVSQDAVSTPPCTYALSSDGQTVPNSAGQGAPVTVTTSAGCSWAAGSNVNWITLVGPASGSGTGTVAFTVTANPGPQRTGIVTIGGRPHTVTQAAAEPAPCAYAINPTSSGVGAVGGTVGPITVTTTAGCAWTSTSNASWITVTSGASGSGSGAVVLSAALNIGGQRTGTVTIAGQTYTLVQAATVPTCSFSINPSSQNAAAGAGTGSTSVTTTAGCAWTAASNSSWITVTAGATGTGNGSVSFSIAANATPARAGTLTVAGQTFTVNQASGCNFAISPTERSVNRQSRTGTITVTGSSQCSWTAVSNVSWLTITQGSPNAGNGTVHYAVAANSTDDEREGTITVAGLIFTLHQND